MLILRFKREISDNIQALARHFPCLVLTGARQVGKTTLLREIFPDHRYVSLDLPSVAETAESNPQLFFAQNPPPVVIDEVQYAPGLFRYLKAEVDRDRHRMGQYVLTGSQSFPLMKGLSDSLAGRAAILSLENLSLAELASERRLDPWEQILARGLYPELWRQPEMDPAVFYSSYLATYLERDVRQILNVGNLRDFERLLRAAATRCGQLLNYSDLARDVGIKPQTAKDWVSVLQASNQIFLLEPYFENIGKRITKSPKLYFHDCGLLSYLLGLDASTLLRSPLIGGIWETLVYSELRKRMTVTEGPPGSLWYYRDGQGNEVDFLCSRGGRLDLIECKWTEAPDDRWIQGLKNAADYFRRSKANEVGRLALVCRASQRSERQGVELLNPAGIRELFRTVD